MLSTKELFYGTPEPVWILKADMKGEDAKNPSSSTKGQELTAYPNGPLYPSILFSDPYRLLYTKEYIPIPAQEDAKGKTDSNGKDKEKETKVVLKVPICCSECEDLVKVALYGLKGVKSVECVSYKEKVTVVTTTAAIADILIECRKLFKQSRMWTDEDTP